MKNKYYIYIFIISIVLFQKVFWNFYIKEVLPNTDNDTLDEYVWILYNWSWTNSLSGYTLSDLAWKTYTFWIDLFEKWELKKYYRPTTKILLNDTNETLYLKDSFWILVDTFSYATTENWVVYKKNEDITIINLNNQTWEIIESETNSWSIVEEFEEQNIDEILEEELDNLNSEFGTWEILNEEIEEIIIESTGSIEENIFTNNTWSIIETENTSTGSIENTTTNSWSLINNSNTWTINSIIIKNLSIKNTFQSPTYLNEKEIELKNNLVYNCDRTKDDCRINLDLRTTFNTEIKEADFNCNINFWLSWTTWEENKCNPNTIIFPVWSYEIKIKVINKLNLNYFWELNFRIINDWKLIQTQTITNYVSSSSTYNETTKLVLNEPIIKVQSGLNDRKICDKKECSINFDSDITKKNITCKWDFWSGSYISWNDKKCNPNIVYYWPWNHTVFLEVCDINYDDNCKKSDYTFENIYKKISLESIITIQWKMTKNKVLEWKKIICYDVDACSINLTWWDSKWEDINFFWDFWDWDFSESKNPLSKVFKKWNYTVILEVSDEDWDLREDYLEIEVRWKDDLIQALQEKDINQEIDKTLSSIEKQELHSLKIDLQWKLWENKILNDNKLTCIKTCSVNFDWSKSIWSFKSYFWDFWNWETYIWDNPWYIKYNTFWNYIVLFSAEDYDWNMYEKQFFITYIEKLIKAESKVILKTNTTLNSENSKLEEITENYLENENTEEITENKTQKNKLAIWVFIILCSIWAYILMLRHKII